ncbi:MAG: hypothetical protein RLZZ450_1370 [Pseudomonadota bacterium]|jgi:amino acid adenylation domain-containing protein/non-ribosomal peptide synthase protein (TIGR01720 family)
MERSQARALAERFLALPSDKQRIFVSRLAKEGIEISSLPIPRSVSGSDEGPLSHAQERLWFLWRLEPDSAAYNIALALALTGPLDAPLLERALGDVVARHAALRTRFVECDGQTVQRVDADAGIEVERFDLTQERQNEERARELARTIAQRPFDLVQGPLLRAALIALAPDRQVLVVVVHHIVADGWSLNVALRELAVSYASRRAGHEPAFPALPIEYTDYARFQRAALLAGELERRLVAVRPILGGEQPVLELPLDRPRPRTLSERGEVVEVVFSPELVRKLSTFARARSSTVFAAVLSTFNVLLHRYSGERDVRVGVPVANRERPELAGLVGLFVNTLVVRNELSSRQTFEQLFEQVNTSVRVAQAQQDLPFDRLVDALSPTRSLDRNPLFQVLYNHQARATAALREFSALTARELPWGAGAAQFDLSLDTEEDDDGVLRGRFTYASELFERTSIERLTQHFVELLWEVTDHPERRLSELAPLSLSELASLARSWLPDTNSAAFAPVHALIVDRAQHQADRVALLPDRGNDSFSYARLEHDTRVLARCLQKRGVGPEVRVAVSLQRGPEMIVAMLAVLRAGGAFVPLDPAYPSARLEEMLLAAQPALLLTERALVGTLPALPGLPVLVVEDGTRAGGPDEPLREVALHPEHLAYVIFTSGSTGKPKGVAMTHGSLSMHCQAVLQSYRMRADDCALHFASISFDASIEQWIVPLMVGARLLVRGPQLWSAEECVALIRQHRVSWFEMPPLYLTQVAASCIERGERLALRACSVGGEAVSRESFDLIKRAIGGAPLVNGYGPTETAITPLVWIAEGQTSFEGGYAPIGTVVGTRAAYVLSADLTLVPVGVTGELYLGLGGLARGYHAAPALTAERFVPNPFAPSGRMYRTGDLVKRRSDGQIEYVGRADHQIKIRGFRVELGEIEARLRAQPSVREAVVVTHEREGTKQLVGYVAVEHGRDVASELLAQLTRELPAHMVPSIVVCLSSLPRTASGKVDRKALPAPVTRERAFVAPTSEREQLLASLWCELLGVPNVGAFDNFFELGGDSILSLQLISRAQRAGLLIATRDVFQHQTLRALAQVARDAGAAAEVEALPTGDVALTPIQHDFFAQVIPRRDHYNQAVLLEVREPLDTARLRRALAQVVAHHDALRLRFSVHEDGSVVQRYASESEADGDVLWVREVAHVAALQVACEEAQRSLRLDDGPLLRALYSELPGLGARLLLVVHHLVIDGVSWRVLLEDLNVAYARAPIAGVVALPAKTTSFARWTAALQQLAGTPELVAELPYWRQVYEGVHAQLPAVQGADTHYGETQSETFRFSRPLTAALLRRAPAAYRTHVHELLLTALARALSVQTGVEHALIELEGHGREELPLRVTGDRAVDVSRTVGWFTSLFPVRLHASGPLADAIVSVKETLRQVPRRGLGVGVLAAHGAADVRAELAALPRPRITFNYLGQFGQERGADDGLFAPAKESVGTLRDPAGPLGNWLEIDGQVYDDELSLRFQYSPKIHDADRVRGLVEAFARALTEIVEHCIEPEVGVLTPSDVPLSTLTRGELARLSARRRDIEDVYPLTPLQQGMLFQSLFAPAQQTYVSQLDLTVHDLEVSRFVAAFEAALARHPVLRTAFVWQEGAEPLQVVQRAVRLPVEQRELAGQGREADRLLALCEAEHARGFALDEAPLLRLVVVRLDARRHHLIWTHHHLLLDGWSSSRLLGEVLQSYAGERVDAPRSSYRDYLQFCAAQSKAGAEALFREALWDAERATHLAPLRSDVSDSYAFRQHELDAATSAELKAFARRERVTVNTVVQAAYGLILQRFTGRDVAVFGATVAGRPATLAHADELVGMFINTLPVAVRARGAQTVGELLRTVQSTTAQLRELEHTPLADIQRWLGTPGRSLFDALLVFENFPVARALDAHRGALKFSDVRHRERTEYPLTLAVAIGDTLRFSFGYTGALETAFVERFAQHFVRLLHAFVVSADRKVGALSLLSADERAELHGFGRAGPSAARLPPVHEAIAARALRTPNKVAIVCDGEQLTYGELNRRVERLAQRLLRTGLGREQRVGVCVERSVSAVVAMLGVLSAGAAFVPLDPEYPSERLRTMADDAGVRALVIGDTSRVRLDPAPGVVCVNLHDDTEDGSSVRAPKLCTPSIERGQLAYVIYTSGSTGKPKGVAVSHGALAEHCAAALVAYGLGEHDVGLEFAPFSFDAALEQWLLPLLAGGRLVVRGAEIWTPEEAHRVLTEERVTWLELPPSYCAELAHWALRNDKTLPLRVCALGGEGLPREGLRAIRALAPAATIVNAYGPAEAVITPLVWHDDGAEPETAYAPLGRPIAARTMFVLDENLEPAPSGVIGELYIEGDTLARGYHAQPALTAARFLPGQSGVRLYRTGDLGRFLADGTLEFVGRRDHQIKLRGFRIELGEIESALLTHADVSEAVVLLIEGSSAPRLVAYVAAQHEPPADALREHLKTSLPRHMLPSHVVVLEALPRTPNGKVDRKALLAIEAPRRSYVAARTDDERALAVLFAALLHSDRPIGVSDDFFECGGDSLLALRLVARIKDELGVELPVRTIFEVPELGALAERVAQARSGADAEQDIRDAIAQVENLNEDALLALLREAEAG